MSKIVFFSKSFAFNRLVRLRYYEKIFPKETDIFLITTDSNKDQNNWKLGKTKVITLKYSPLRNLIEIRNFCKAHKIDILSNIGHPFGAIPLIFSTIFTKKKNLLYFLGDSISYPETDLFTKSGVKAFFSLAPYFILTKLSDKIAFVGKNSYERAPTFFMSPRRKFHYLHAPVNTDLFKPIEKKEARRKLKIPQDKKIVLYVGRVTKRKGGEYLREIILSHPEIEFWIIGKWYGSEISKFKIDNLKFIEKVPNEDLPTYYSAADITFAYHRQGCQMGIVGEESLACGTPIIHTKRTAFKDDLSLIKVSDSTKEMSEKISEFFNKSSLERKNISKFARDYAIQNCSDTFWKERYLNFYLK